MTAKEARDELQALFGDFTGEPKQMTLPPAMVFRWLNRGAGQIAYRLLCLDGVQVGATTSGVAVYGLPANFLKVTAVVYDDRLLTELRKNLQGYVYDDTGTPESYTIQPPRSIRLWPIPNASKSLIVHFRRRPTAVSADGDEIDLPEELAELCVDYALWRMCMAYRPELAPQAWQTFEAGFRTHQETAKKRVTGEIQRPVDDFFGGGVSFRGIDVRVGA